MLIGTIKLFKPEGGYGFLRCDGYARDIFFHLDDGRLLRITGETLKWTDLPKDKRFRDPKAGETIAFELATRPYGDDRLRAYRWTFARYYTAYRRQLEQQMTSRPTYRIKIRYSYPSGKTDEPKVEWQGQNLADPKLTQLWNRTYDPGFYSGSDFSVTKWFEVKQPDGTWTPCDDPRS